MKLNWQKFEVNDGNKFKLAKMPTAINNGKPDEDTMKQLLQADIDKIASLQFKLYAENRQSLLIILQGLDASGKDGAIKHIMSGINPQGVSVHSFKHPSTTELEHDYLWRHYQQLPEKGQITIFNRSHYENVLISKVHPELVLAERIPGVETVKKVDNAFWKKRYEQIRLFEDTIMHNGTHILKFFLNISKEEQRKRFLERLEDREKHWKFNAGDIAEREYWDKYQDAYQDAIKYTATKRAPWYVMPADSKWYCRLLISKIILQKLERMAPVIPKPGKEEDALMNKARKQLLKEG